MESTKKAFLTWYQPIHEGFVRFCSTRSFGVMETEDLVQEAILGTLEAYDRIENKEKLLSYMIGVASNIVRNKKRRFKFRGEWNEQLMQELEDKTTNPEIAADIHFLLKAMNQLPARQKEALELFEISGFSIKEISRIQESSETATKTRISRARKNLRKSLQDTTSKRSLSSALTVYANILL